MEGQAGSRGPAAQVTRSVTARLAERSALLELAPDAIFARDADRRITFWNRSAEELYGYSREEALGRRPAELLRTDYPLPLDEIERHVEEEGIWEGDLVQVARDGRRLTVASRWGAVYGEDGRLVSLLEINRDITERLQRSAEAESDRAQQERERMSARLVRSQRLESLGHLAGGIAHDFNNLLAVIGGYASVARRRLERAPDRLSADLRRALDDDLVQIGDATERAASLTRQLLAFARQESVRAEVIDLNAAVTDMLELLRRTLGPHIELRARLEAGCRVRMDPGQLGQILVNLTVNSRAAMPTGGRLTIDTSPAVFDAEQPLSHGVLSPGTYMRLRVGDSGVGMDREVVERAFDPFFTTKPVGEGTGLGLATVYGIVTQAGGQVEIYSEPGRGTTVTILLPAATDATTPATESPRPAPPTAAVPATVLIVEDEPALRRVIAATVRDAGYTVLSASGSAEALELAGRHGTDIDLLLTDVVMPGMLGQQLARELGREHPGLKVVFMSGFAQPFIGDARGERLEDPLLQKPFTEAELLNRLADSLRSP